MPQTLDKPNAMPSFSSLVKAYENTEQHNDQVWKDLNAVTWTTPELAGHRKHVEANKLGYGDPAFHGLWAALLPAAAERFGKVRALEIGVYKGQVISLWSLLARAQALNVEVSAISPLAGQPAPRGKLVRIARYLLDRKFREQVVSGNIYADEDYEKIVRDHYAYHGLDFNDVRLHRGYSTDAGILSAVTNEKYHIVYVDGDHTYDGALHDFKTFGPKVVKGGWLVADDASCDLPSTAFWKGHQAVSRAVREVPAMGFKNVLNVGHNRVYERVAD